LTVCSGHFISFAALCQHHLWLAPQEWLVEEVIQTTQGSCFKICLLKVAHWATMAYSLLSTVPHVLTCLAPQDAMAAPSKISR